ncbi:MAG: ABC transporter ATP-binding protein [Candidatus Omnitrophota bacterium]
MEPLLAVTNLHTYFYTDAGVSRAAEGVSFAVYPGETLALVGESGCGKTVTALSIMRLLPPAGKIVQGEIKFRGKNLLSLPEGRMRDIRGRDIGMVFQEPMSALNPLFTIGFQIGETISAHQKNVGGRHLRERVIQLLQQVEIPSPEERYNDYPHNLSGGLRQRAMIAQALALSPGLLIADEPTTALDVTIQAQILDLFLQLQEKMQMAVLLITHDLGIVAEVADRVCIMYAGRIVEQASVLEIFNQAKHPYTQGLLNSIPGRRNPRERLLAIPGTVPHPADKPAGCPFHPRCPQADKRCREELPQVKQIDEKHSVCCWKV